MGEHALIRPCVFLDRDGVIVKTIRREHAHSTEYTAPHSYEEFEFYPDARASLEILRAKSFRTILVTNQPDIAKGKISMEEWQKIHREVIKLPFDKVCVCFHTDRDNCDCRKPKAGMLFAAREALKITSRDMLRSFMVGDTYKDMRAGRVAGVRTILIRRPYNSQVQGDFCVGSLMEAVNVISNLTVVA